MPLDIGLLLLWILLNLQKEIPENVAFIGSLSYFYKIH